MPHSQSHCPLYKLPAEIQLMIWKHLLAFGPSDRKFLTWIRPQTPLDKAVPWNLQEFKDKKRKRVETPGFMLVCKRLYHEIHVQNVYANAELTYLPIANNRSYKFLHLFASHGALDKVEKLSIKFELDAIQTPSHLPSIFEPDLCGKVKAFISDNDNIKTPLDTRLPRLEIIELDLQSWPAEIWDIKNMIISIPHWLTILAIFLRIRKHGKHSDVTLRFLGKIPRRWIERFHVLSWVCPPVKAFDFDKATPVDDPPHMDPWQDYLDAVWRRYLLVIQLVQDMYAAGKTGLDPPYSVFGGNVERPELPRDGTKIFRKWMWQQATPYPHNKEIEIMISKSGPEHELSKLLEWMQE